MVRECGHEGRWVVVLSNRLRSRRHRSLRPLGWALALVAASLAASAFVGTARADDPQPPVASGTATDLTPTSTDTSTPSTDLPTSTEPQIVPATTQAVSSDAPAVSPDPPPVSSDPPPPVSSDPPPPVSSDPSPPVSSDPSPPVSSDPPPVSSDPPPPVSSDPPPVSSDPPVADTKTPSIAAPAPPTTSTAPPAASTNPPPATTDTPPTTDVTTEGSSPQFVGAELVTIVPFPTSAGSKPKLRAVGAGSWLDDCRLGGLCGVASFPRSPFESAQALFNSWPLRGASPTQPGARSGGDRDRTEGAQPPRAPIPPPAPNHQPDGPTAPGAFFGFSSSGGFHNGGLLALMAVLLGFTFLQSTRRVTPPEQRVHGPLLVLSLERPG
jgi:hypothetical protein